MRIIRSILVATLLAALASVAFGAPLVVYTPRKIITMEPAMPEATAVAARSDTGVRFVAWGYHPLWHGEVYRPQLNAWFPHTPVMLWHRSFHELTGNDAAFAMLGITEADARGNHESDWAVVSANPYYHYLLSDIYSELWLGQDRGHRRGCPPGQFHTTMGGRA